MEKKLFVLLITLCLLLTGCGKSEAVLDVEKQISAIGTVTLQSLENIEKAEAEYAALSPKEKEEVSNCEVLEESRREYEELVKKQNDEKVSAVEKSIEKLANVTIESKNDIESARKAYNELDASLQKRVSNLQVLIDAEERFALLQEVTAINFKTISCDLVNVFKDVSFNYWFDDNYSSATLAILFLLQGDKDGWADISDMSPSGMIICQNKEMQRYDLLLLTKNNSFYHIQYWPKSKVAKMATENLHKSASEYAELLKDAGVIEKYKEIPLESIADVLQDINDIL